MVALSIFNLEFSSTPRFATQKKFEYFHWKGVKYSSYLHRFKNYLRRFKNTPGTCDETNKQLANLFQCSIKFSFLNFSVQFQIIQTGSVCCSFSFLN